MTLASRLKRLETAIQFETRCEGRKTFEQALADFYTLHAWLDEHGYADCLSALEADASIPEELEEPLREQAAYDPRRRAWARIEAALDAGQLPHDVDLRLVSLLPSGLLPIPLARPAAGYTVPGRRKNLSPSQEIPRSA